ncbi:MAG: hypothetical protein ACKVQJ_06020 [Pyrinomonadaceae bacterium]
MKKSLLYRLFGVGKLPAEFADGRTAESIVLSDEGLAGSVTYRNFRRPGKYSAYQSVGLVGSIVVTNERIAAYSGENPIIDVEFTDERLRQIAFSVLPNGSLLAAFDASLFHADWSGNIEYRFKTPMAAAIVERIHSSLPST